MEKPTLSIGRLHRQNIRDVWPKEDADFTQWLALPENLDLLADTLGLGSLDEIQNEVSVGNFRADVVCHDPDGHKVVIENQFATSDHKHLGQILTYLAGVEAKTVIWIAESIREEHRAAIDWLNEATALDYAFFGVEIEVWRIGDSDAAPRFEVVVQPNQWKRRQIQKTQQAEMVDYQRRMEYWGAFLVRWPGAEGLVPPSRAPNQGWLKLAFSETLRLPTGGGIFAYRLMSEGRIGVYLSLVRQDRADIGTWAQYAARYQGIDPAGWQINKNGHWQYFVTLDADAADESDWPRQHDWMIATIFELLQVWSAGMGQDAAEWGKDEDSE